MAITKRPAKVDKKAEDFIKGAPDAANEQPPATERFMKGKRAQISLTLPPERVDALDRLGERLGGISRASLINMAIAELLESRG